ncbi:MAG: methylenetetrahydrofolate--tRNA-(uracil(54)-C(5))-methyltransferase (FADH(2)-oxidizing) TrmFO [Bdellovibrionota bacterium]
MATGKPTIHIAGAGLAGSECALQLADLGYDVVLIEMRGEISTPAHRTTDCAELVCSNSFGSLNSASAPGQLKWEAERLGSKILESAFVSRVPAGQALSMDREVFAREMTAKVEAHPHIKLERRVVHSLDELPRPCVVATGPLTHDDLAKSMQEHFGGDFLYFFDAIAPIVSADSINMDIAWRADRWNKGTKDYINCPMSKDEYNHFIEEMKLAKKTEPKEFEKNTPYFDGCMPIEAMLERGNLTPRFGPMSPKGLDDPRTGCWAFAVVQLRQDNREATAYNIVGFQTKMAYSEQKRIFRMVPGLENAEFLKLGSIHRNLYINTPKGLNKDLSSKKDPMLFFAGQITGVEGYFESTCMGMLVARFMDAKVQGKLELDASNIEDIAPPRASALGSLLDAITDVTKIDHFQPTNINFGHMPAIEKKMPKDQKRQLQIANARKAFLSWAQERRIELRDTTSVTDAAAALKDIIDAAKAAEVAAKAAEKTAELALKSQSLDSH